VLFNPTEATTFNSCLHHTILRIIITHGGEKFQKFQKELRSTQPETDAKIELHKTALHPLPPMNIDESTIIGNADVVEAVTDELELKKCDSWLRRVRFFAGDQLSIARLRALVNIRAGHEAGFCGFAWGVWIPGLFHAKIADIHGFFVTHWGKPNAGTRNPGCLAFHNTRLNRNPILLTSLPTFRTCRDLVFVSLYARVLHCLLLVSRKETLDDYADSIDSFTTLEGHARDIFNCYANVESVFELRWERRAEAGRAPVPTGAAEPKELLAPKEGDMVFENAVLFLRDALISREFTDSIKSGDSGRIVLALKALALSYRGNGRTKYAYEMLHVIHNISHVWPKRIWCVNVIYSILLCQHSQ
jgi:hypothetical protein